MTMSLDRREWLVSAGALGLGLGLTRRATAIDPIERPKPPLMRLSLSAYSFNRQLRLGNAARSPTMSLEEFIDFAAMQPLAAVELTAYYFPKTTRDYLVARKGQCTRLGLDVSGTAVGNDFCVVDRDKWRKEVDQVKQWIEHTSLLGGKTIRVFAGKQPKGDSLEAAQKRAIAGLEEVCDHAGQFGVYVGLENHGGITASAEQLLTLVKAVQSPWFGVNLDSGNFRTPDPYGDLARLAPYAVNVQIKTEIHPAGQDKQPADLQRLITMLREVSYRGYVVLEYEGVKSPRQAVPNYLQRLRELL